MNALSAWLRSGNSDLRPTPTIPPSHATLEALHTISPLAFHSVFPTLENFTKLWERPGAYDLIDNSLLYKVNRQEWEEWMYMEESDTSSPTVGSFVKVPEPLPSLPTEEISSIERVRRWLATYQPLPLQNWLATPPTLPSSDAPDDAPTTSHVQDRAEGQQAIGRALVSIQKRRPEARRKADQGVERREEVTNIMKTCMQRRGSH